MRQILKTGGVAASVPFWSKPIQISSTSIPRLRLIAMRLREIFFGRDRDWSALLRGRSRRPVATGASVRIALRRCAANILGSASALSSRLKPKREGDLMTDFLIGAATVVATAFAMFLVARRTLTPGTTQRPAAWLALIAGMCFAVFVTHRLLGHGLSVPACTVILFAIAINALDTNYPEGVAELIAPVAKQGRWAAIAGGIAGWLTYAEVVG